MQEEARAHGWLVFAMKQSETAYHQNPEYGVSQGFCLGMACQWLWDMYHHRTFKSGADMVCSLPPLKGVRVQAATQDVEISGDGWQQWDAGLRAYSMRRDPGLGLDDSAVNTPKSEDMAELLSKKMAESVGGYALSFKGVRGHAMAMFRSPGQFDLFDANRGHFRFQAKSAEVSFALEWFLDHTGYMKKLALKTRLCKVNKPHDRTISESEYSRPKFGVFEHKILPSEKKTLSIIKDNPDPVLKVIQFTRPKANPGEKRP